MKATVRATLIAALLLGMGVAGCGDDDDDGGGSGSDSINVAIVDNPQMKDIADLTPELFTKKSGVKVNYTILDEGTLRQVTTRDVAAGGRRFDVVMIGPLRRRGSEGTAPSRTSISSPRATARTGSTTLSRASATPCRSTGRCTPRPSTPSRRS